MKLAWVTDIHLNFLEFADRKKSTRLLKEDCWADGRYGNYTDSRVMLNDGRMIQELREGNIIGKYQLLFR